METVITKGSNGLPHHFTDLRGWTATKVTPWQRHRPTTWKANNGKVTAFIATPAFTGTDMAFTTRDQLLTFVRACIDSDYVNGRIYAGGYDGKGDFLVVGQAITRQHYGLVRPTGRTKLAIEDIGEEVAA